MKRYNRYCDYIDMKKKGKKKMAKIIKIENDIVSIGTDDGGIAEFLKKDFAFEPFVGDEVEVFATETKTIISKKEESSAGFGGNGVNINVQNTNGVQPTAYISGKAVNKVAYCLLCFFLGGLGVHKFYAGKIGLGILYLLFSWTFVPVIISVIELLIALFKKSDSNGMIIV